MKKLDIKAFWILLSGVAATIIYRVVDIVISKGREYPKLEERLPAERYERMTTAMYRLGVGGSLIVCLVCAYIIYRLVANKNQKQGQGYITFLSIISIIAAVLNALTLLFGNLTSLISLAIAIILIVGCSIQKNYE